MEDIRKIWDELSGKEEPLYLRNVISVDYNEFSLEIENSNAYCKSVIENLFSGDIYVVNNSITEIESEYLKKFVHSRGKFEPLAFKTEPGCPNYHQKVTNIVDPNLGYSTVNHSHYFFEWNHDSRDIFEILDKPWWIGKFLSGKDHDPSNSINRVHFLHYPLNDGFISSHMDFPIEQMVNTYVSLTSPGKDYIDGGFYAFDTGKNKIHLDSMIPKGSLVCWYPTVIHGADSPMPTQKRESDGQIDWESEDGRWIVIMNTIQPHSKQNRRTTKSVII